MRQGITTKYLGPTYSKGARVKAIARKREDSHPEMAITVPWTYDFGTAETHCRAAKALAEKLGWNGVWIGGGTPNETGFQFVALGGSFSRAWVDKYLCGTENVDWFLVDN